MARRLVFALLDAEDACKWVGHEAIWQSLYGGPDVTWLHFRAFADELPSREQLQTIDALLVTGSHHDAHGEVTHPWIGRLAAFLREAVATPDGPRILGTCFGCQLLARALGGDSGPNPSGKFVFKAERLRPTAALLARADFCAALAAHRPALAAATAAIMNVEDATEARFIRSSCGGGGGSGGGADYPVEEEEADASVERAAQTPREAAAAAAAAGLASCAGRPGSAGGLADVRGAGASSDGVEESGAASLPPLYVLESHGDCVLHLPPDATLLASSASASIEAWALGGRVLATQGHPELSVASFVEKIQPCLLARGRLSEEEVAAAHESFRLPLADRLLLEMGRLHLRGSVAEGRAALAAAAEEPPLPLSLPSPGGPVPALTSPSASPARARADAPTALASTSAAAPPPLRQAAYNLSSSVIASVNHELAAAGSDYAYLAALNGRAAERYEALAATAADRAGAMRALREASQAQLSSYEASVASIEEATGALEAAVGGLAETAGQLEERLRLPLAAGSGGGGSLATRGGAVCAGV